MGRNLTVRCAVLSRHGRFLSGVMEMSELQVQGTRYAFATLGARTERGGYVTCATSRMSICGLAVARVGDIVTYRDGSEAVIVDGAGKRFVDHGNAAH